jgi:hypothetical protein
MLSKDPSIIEKRKDLLLPLLENLLHLLTFSMDELKNENDESLDRLRAFLLTMMPAQPSSLLTDLNSLSIACMATVSVATGTVNEVLSLTAFLLELSLTHVENGTHHAIGFPVVKSLKNWEEKVR